MESPWLEASAPSPGSTVSSFSEASLNPFIAVL